ncbi:MAG: hypothetical protein C0446_08330 [Chitinophaga sp.]|nr:hypothetical protein [Chitinophaga sp.]
MYQNITYFKKLENMLEIFRLVFESVGEVSGKPFYVDMTQYWELFNFKIRPEQKDNFDSSNKDEVYRQFASTKLITPMIYTVRHGQDILFFCSIIGYDAGMCDINFLVSEDFINANKAVKFAFIRCMKKCVEALPFRRLQAKVDTKFEIGQIFLEKLGFEKEGICRKFDKQLNDYFYYALLKE